MTSATTPKTVDLGGDGLQREAIANAAITPGMLLALDANGQVGPHSNAGQEGVVGFAKEYDLTGRGIDDAYASADQVIYKIPYEGAAFYGILASGESVARGALLTSDGTGRLKAAGSTDMVYAIAQEAVNATAAAARIRAMWHKGRGIA